MKKKIPYSIYPYCTALVLITIAWVLIFYTFGQYWDYEDHIKIAKYLIIPEIEYNELLGDVEIIHIFAYPLFHFVLKLMHIVFRMDYRTAVAVLETVMQVSSLFIVRKMATEYTKQKDSYYVDFLSIGIMVFMGARCWLNNWVYYKLQAGPNPLQNPTIIFVRPFGLLAFYFFVKTFEKRRNIKELVLFAICLELSILSKPSWAFAFLPAMGIYTLICMIRDKSIMLGVKNLLAVSPGVATLFWQLHFMTSTSQIMNGTYIHFGTYYDYSFWLVLGITFVMTPTVFIMCKPSYVKKSPALIVALLSLLVSWCQYFLLTEGGMNNYSWGYDLAIQTSTLIFMCSAIRSSNDDKFDIVRKNAAYILFIYQCIVGICYMCKVYMTNDYRF